MNAPEYRTPDEVQFTDDQEARIRAVLDQAVHDGASCKLAMMFGDEPDVVERWVDAVWNGLRDGLADDQDHPTLRAEDRLAAIVLLLDQRMDAEVASVLRSVGGPR
jgi:hypothetical protein